MCGIIGYIGKKKAKDVVLHGLTSLEYRGYDSAGIAGVKGGTIFLDKAAGELFNLKEKLKDITDVGMPAIGHTRWATHGKPSDKNAHPHLSFDKKFAIVHNGIIENFVELKKLLSEKHRIKFASDTDSEVIAHLIAIHYTDDFLEAVQKATLMLKGAFAFSAICVDDNSRMIAVRKDAPLVVGTTEENGNFIASDIPAVLKWTRDVKFIENDEIVEVKEDAVTIFDETLKEIKRDITHIDWSVSAAEKGGYKHFMLKEIFEQPNAIKETLCRRLDDEKNILIDSIKISKSFIKNIDKIYVVACGTAYHAGLSAKNVIEKLTRIPVEVAVASEFRYKDPILTKKSLCLAISQSGETLDTLEGIREAKRKGARILSIVNVIGSSIARESDDVFYTWAGPEIAVASTKAYTTQLICVYLLGLYFANKIGSINKGDYLGIINELEELPKKIMGLLKEAENIKNLAKKYYKKEQFFFIGRGFDVPSSYEASLKLKEISYINSFAIEAGELKHGTIALINKDSVVLALATQEFLLEKVLSNAEEIMAREGRVIPVVKAKNKKFAEQICDEMFTIPNADDIVMPIISIIPLQLFAYYIADERKESIDKPKNLAKSVTVE